MLLYDLYVYSMFSMVKIFTNYLGAISRFWLQAGLFATPDSYRDAHAAVQ